MANVKQTLWLHSTAANNWTYICSSVEGDDLLKAVLKNKGDNAHKVSGTVIRILLFRPKAMKPIVFFIAHKININ